MAPEPKEEKGATKPEAAKPEDEKAEMTEKTEKAQKTEKEEKTEKAKEAEKAGKSDAKPTDKKTDYKQPGLPFTRTFLTLFVFWAGICKISKVPNHPEPPDVLVKKGTAGWEAKLRENLATHGYAHVPSLLSRSEVEGLRKVALDFCYGETTRKALPLSYGGYSVPSFLDIPEFEGARWLKEDQRLHGMLEAAFGNKSGYRFVSHNDVGCDFVGVWHKDVLRGKAAEYQECDVWSPDQAGEEHEIYKIIFYLQDHDQDEQAMKVIPGSHIERRTPWERGYVALHPTMGDAVIFDQRLSHAGNTHYDIFGKGRLFMQVGFGRKNQFTDHFEKGTIERQEMLKDRMLKRGPVNKGFWTHLADARFVALGTFLSWQPPQVLNYFADRVVEKHEEKPCNGTEYAAQLAAAAQRAAARGEL